MSRHRSGVVYQNISAALKVPKNTVASIILKWMKFGTTKTLLRAGRLAKLSNRGRRALLTEVTKDAVVTLEHSSSVEIGEKLPEGQSSLQHSTKKSFMVERPDRSHSSVKRHLTAHLELTKRQLKDSDHEKQDDLV